MVLGPLWGTHTLWNYYVMMAAPLLMALLVTVLERLIFNLHLIFKII